MRGKEYVMCNGKSWKAKKQKYLPPLSRRMRAHDSLSQQTAAWRAVRPLESVAFKYCLCSMILALILRSIGNGVWPVHRKEGPKEVRDYPRDTTGEANDRRIHRPLWWPLIWWWHEMSIDGGSATTRRTSIGLVRYWTQSHSCNPFISSHSNQIDFPLPHKRWLRFHRS